MGLSLDLTVVALHGFLGEPSDWDGVSKNLSFPFVAVDYTHLAELSPQHQNLQTWGPAFLQWLEANQIKRPYLVGYSQGGRLALHAFTAQPQRFAGLTLLSTNVGLPAGEIKSRQERLAQDQIWAERFRSDPWHEVMQSWNSQSVFQGSQQEPRRSEAVVGRERAAAALQHWSLGHQKDFREDVIRWGDKIQMMVGQRDSKYLQMAETFRSKIKSVTCISDAGHRVLLDAPALVASNLVKNILNP